MEASQRRCKLTSISQFGRQENSDRLLRDPANEPRPEAEVVLSKSQRRRRRRKKEKNYECSEVHKFGYKSNMPIVRRLNLYSNVLKEGIPKRLSPRLEVDDLVQKALQGILNVQVGVEFKEAGTVLQSPGFITPLRSMLSNYKKINFRALVDRHCPRRSEGDFNTSSRELNSYLRSVIHQVNLAGFLGGAQNSRILENSLKWYFYSPMQMEVPARIYIQNLQLQAVPWAQQLPKNLAVNVLAKVVLWIVTVLMEGVVGGFFKSTDSRRVNAKRKIFFYRKSTWQSMITRALHRLEQSNYMFIPVNFYRKLINARNPPTISILRFLPKNNMVDVRPIARPETKSNHCFDAKDALKTIAEQFPAKSDLLGKTFYAKWTKFVKNLGQHEKVYWVVVDILDAFGSIDLSRLKKILDEFTTPENREILAKVKQRMFLHVVKCSLGRRTARFIVKKGVLQGDFLSSVLSDIYYGHMTHHVLHEFTEPPHTTQEIFLRRADDFLFMSTDRRRAEKFWRTVSAGCPKYSCVFKKEKTQTNLDIQSQDSPGWSASSFTYCGTLINMKNRSIEPNTASYVDSNIGYAQTWPSLNKSVGLTVMRKFRFLCGLKLTPLYFNKVNTKETCLRTLATNVYLAIQRLTVMLDVLIVSRRGKIQEQWLWRVVMAGLRRFQLVAKFTDISVAEVRLVCLKTLSRQATRKIYPVKFIQGVKNVLRRMTKREEAQINVNNLFQVVRNVPLTVKNVKATSSWK